MLFRKGSVRIWLFYLDSPLDPELKTHRFFSTKWVLLLFGFILFDRIILSTVQPGTNNMSSDIFIVSTLKLFNFETIPRSQTLYTCRMAG